MKCFFVAKRIIKQLIKDKRSLALLFVAPPFLIFLLSVILNCSIDKPNILQKDLPQDMVSSLKDYANVTTTSNRADSMNDLKLRKYDAFLTMSDNKITINLEGTQTAVNSAVKKAVASAVSDYMKTLVEDQKAKVTEIQNTNKDNAQRAADSFKSSFSELAEASGKEVGIMEQLKAVQTMQNKALTEVNNVIATLMPKNQNSISNQKSQQIQQNAYMAKQQSQPTQQNANMAKLSKSYGQLKAMSTKSKDILSSANNQLAEIKSKLESSKSNSIEITQSTADFELNMIDTEIKYIHGSDDITTFNAIAPMMMGFFIFFFVFIMAGVSFLRERISGTLDRLLATPVKRIEIVLGYFLGFGIFVLVQTLEIQLFMIYCLNIELEGNFFLVLLINILLAAGSLALGTLLSAFARNEFQLFQFIPIVIIPQILFCGLFDLRSAPTWVIVLSKIFPLTYAADALTDVVLRGFDISYIYFDLIILACYTAAFLVLNSLALKKYRKL